MQGASLTRDQDSGVAELRKNHKFSLHVGFTQSGKTFIIIDKIDSELKKYPDSLHIIFTMNTLLNNKQFATRLNGLELSRGSGTVVVLAHKPVGNYTHVDNLDKLIARFRISAVQPRVIVMCSNTQRYEDGVELIKKLNAGLASFVSNYCIIPDRPREFIERSIFVYYDELHKYISPKLRGQIEQIHEIRNVREIIAMTASPFNIFSKNAKIPRGNTEGCKNPTGFWEQIKIYQNDNMQFPDYVGFRDMKFVLVEPPGEYGTVEESIIAYIKHILKNHNILTPGARVFIPAHIKTKSHDIVRDHILELAPDTVVVTLNGVQKTLIYKTPGGLSLPSDEIANVNTEAEIPGSADISGDTVTVNLNSGDDEIREVIADTVISRKLNNRPLVITGFLCVGMGQTLTHPDLGSFTSAIISHIDLNNDDIYQLFGRVTGRMKTWTPGAYIPTTIYCPEVSRDRFQVMEECSRNITCNFNGKIVTLEDYIDPMYKMGKIGESALSNMKKHIEPPELCAQYVLLKLPPGVMSEIANCINSGSKKLLENMHRWATPEHTITARSICYVIVNDKTSYKKHLAGIIKNIESGKNIKVKTPGGYDCLYIADILNNQVCIVNF